MSQLRETLKRIGPVRSQVELNRLAQRVAELEEEVSECRRQALRTAELTDIVQALLIPLARRDEAGLDQVLRDYAGKLG